MKIFKHRNLMGLIYSFVIAIPLLSILATSCYAVFNKNAKDSYYGETINQFEIKTPTTTNENTTYELDYQNVNYYGGSPVPKLYIRNFKVKYEGNISSATLQQIYDIEEEIIQLNFAKYNDALNLQIISNETSINLTYANWIFTFNVIGNNDTTVLGNLRYYDYNKYSYLDNAFDYSINKLVSDNSWGKMNLFEWFTDLFLDMNADNNALYIHFVNWYMNYVLFVSCAYILFLVLMWFINYSRRILERGMNYDW